MHVSQRLRLFVGLVSTATAAALMSGAATLPAQAADAPRATAAAASSAPASQPLATSMSTDAAIAGSCIKNGAVSGFASVGHQRIDSAKVHVFARSKSDKKGTFSQELKIGGSPYTNSKGAFYFTVNCLPKEFVVQVTNGRLNGKISKRTMYAFGRSDERATVVTPTTMIAVDYAKKHGTDARTSTKRVKKFLRLVDLGKQTYTLGNATWLKSKTFGPAKYLNAAEKQGGIKKFSRALAKRVSSKKHRTFTPKGYVMPHRPGYPRAGSDGSPRTRAKSVRMATRDSVVSGTLTGMASIAGFNVACAALPPSPTSNMVCASDNDDQEILNELDAISEQLTVLQQSVNDIISTLSVMETQLTEIQSALNEIESQNSNQLQQTLLQDAQTAQQDYQDAYSYAGITQIQSQVNNATFDLQVLGSITPQTTWTPTKQTSNEAICLTMYSALNISSGTNEGQNPLSLCEDFLSQIQAFASPSNAYYNTIYTSLVGGSGVPQDDLLIWTLQDMLTYGGNAPVSTSVVNSVQEQGAQLGALMDNAYALLASGQMFEYGATTGNYTTCGDLTTSGTFSASTVISVASACNTLETGLFAASLQNMQATQIAVPPTGSVADPRTNYVWWGYPVDLTGVTAAENSSYPFYPGAPAGTYNTSTGSPLQLWAWTNQYNQTCCSTSIYWWSTWYPSNPSPKLLPASPGYNFYTGSAAQNATLLSNLLVTDAGSVEGTFLDSGFVGIGDSAFGMNWTQLGMNPMYVDGLQTWEYYQSTTNMPTNTPACTGYPQTSKGTFQCYSLTNKSGQTLTGTQALVGTFASQAQNLDTATLPDSSDMIMCPNVGNFYQASTMETFSGAMCQTDTFGLLVDTDAATNSSVLPPFYSTKMLAGPPSSGVPATVVTAATPYVATS